MNRNLVTPDLVTLDATVAHPGFDPFAGLKRRRAIAHELSALKLSFAQQVAVGMTLQGIDAGVKLPAEALALIAEHRELSR